MNSALLHNRQRYVRGLRELCDWLEADATKPAPDDMLIGIRLATTGAVIAFASLHQLSEPVSDRGTTHADAVFGPVTYRVYAKAERAVTQ